MDPLREVLARALEPRIFRRRELLLPDYVPEHLPHREREVRRLASVLSPALRGERPSNVFIYGLTGTGKTAVARRVLSRFQEVAGERGLRLRPVYVNVRQRGTAYRIIADMAESIGVRVPFTGLATSEVFDRFSRRLSKLGLVMIVVLDEIDFLVKRYGDDLLYRLTRINTELERSRVSIVGITNSLTFVEGLDPRVKSSLGEEELVFAPYNAQQLRDILHERAREAFNPGALEGEVIPLCAALAAREHGDARRALDLLRVAGEIAERLGDERVTRGHVMRARVEIERDRVSEIVRTLPFHAKLVLAAILAATMGGRTYATTGEVYDEYSRLASSLGYEKVTPRRVTGIIAELDMLGIVSGRVVSRGRYGKTRMIELSGDADAVIRAIREDPLIEPLWERVGRGAPGQGRGL